MRKIIGLASQMAGGKTISAEYLVGLGWTKSAFADALKKTFMDIVNIDRAFLEEWKRKDSPPPGFNTTIRHSLQWLGDGCRENFYQSIWIDKLFRDCQSADHLVVDDVRYISEVQAIKKRGGIVVAVYRPGYENNIDHPSEAQLMPEIKKCLNDNIDDSIFDYLLLNDGDIPTLYNRIKSELLPFVFKYYNKEDSFDEDGYYK